MDFTVWIASASAARGARRRERDVGTPARARRPALILLRRPSIWASLMMRWLWSMPLKASISATASPNEWSAGP